MLGCLNLLGSLSGPVRPRKAGDSPCGAFRFGTPFAPSNERRGTVMESNGELLIERLRQAIRDCGLTKRELSEAARVAHQLIIDFMNGRNLGI